MSLNVANLRAGYSGSAVLDDVSLEASPGEVVALLGRNGMGKSTLARTIAGSHPATSGKISMFNKPAQASARKRFQDGLRTVRQERPVISGLSVKDNLQLAKVPVSAAAELFSFIGNRADQDAGTLSGGEQKLLAIARVACNPGRLWVLDEPTEGLQPSNVDRCGSIIRAAADEGHSVLLIEQHLQLALSVADRWLILEKGRIVDSGPTTADAYARITKQLAI